jgi:hypothetical protein
VNAASWAIARARCVSERSTKLSPKSCGAVEGVPRSRNVVIEFENDETALACCQSPEYTRFVQMRSPHATNDLIIIEGYDGLQSA